MEATCRECGRPSVTGICYACAWVGRNEGGRDLNQEGADLEFYGSWKRPDSREPSRDGDIPPRVRGFKDVQERDAAYQAVSDGKATVGPLRDGDDLRALIEAELTLSAHWATRHGCNCGRCF